MRKAQPPRLALPVGSLPPRHVEFLPPTLAGRNVEFLPLAQQGLLPLTLLCHLLEAPAEFLPLRHLLGALPQAGFLPPRQLAHAEFLPRMPQGAEQLKIYQWLRQQDLFRRGLL